MRSGRTITDTALDRAFITYGETGCVRAAARAAGVNASTVSRWMRDPRNDQRLTELSGTATAG